MSGIVFEILSSKCGTVQEQVTLETIGGLTVIRGFINVANPCHTIDLREQVDTDKKMLSIFLQVKAIKKICVQCLANLEFRIKINRYYYRELFNSQKCMLKLEYYHRGKRGVLYEGEFEL
ncbi:MAG: hypothetical protein NDP13_01780 [Crenarchaeota archaeon]|nr:hypothetical protein [Thermoproteota archaeon]MCR8453706.1 hypothetical protein [Thermoproteota archaeon]MCR8455760.1 hypothetical protein [Thermoproteota archaeon]MCR8463091.1 hypothetical protein [Thermoproteota archaeon]MCR8470755.1 hypothetical protein [Thermoproteota archaeon]